VGFYGGRADVDLAGDSDWVSCRSGASACRPGPELVRVAYCPDALDPVACELEREYRHGDAALLSHQTGLAVDSPVQERQAGCLADDIDGIVRDVLGPFDGEERGAGDAAARRRSP